MGIFDDASVQRIANTVRALEHKQRGLEARINRFEKQNDKGSQLILGRTTVSPEWPVYPSTGCQFVVQFEDREFDETQLDCPGLTPRVHQDRRVIARTLDGSYVPQGTEVSLLKIYNPKGRRWWIIPTVQATLPVIEPIKLKDISWLLPGERGKFAVLMIWDPVLEKWAEEPGYSELDPDNHELLYDDHYANCLGPGEVVYAKKRPFDATTNPNANKWDIIGSHGLMRRGKCDGDIDCGDEGFFTIYRDEPVDYTDTESCYGGGDKSGVSVCNAFGHRRKLKSADELFFEYDRGQRKWYPTRDVRPHHAVGIAGGDFCQASQVAVGSARWKDWAALDCTFVADDASVGENSKFRLAGEAGDQISLEWDEESQSYNVIQVSHHLELYVEEVYEDSQGQCPVLKRDREYMVTMRSPACGVAPDGTFFSFVLTVAVEDMRQNSQDPCLYEFRTRDICVGSASAPSAYFPFIQAQEVSVLSSVGITGNADQDTCAIGFGITRFCALNPQTGTATQINMTTVEVTQNVRDEADGLYEDRQKVSVICVGTPTSELIVEYTDCTGQSP